jgi:DNA ligase (NAD+)
MNFDHLDHYTVIDAKSRAVELRKQIYAHNHAYYVLANPTITDAEYDQLFADLRELERRWPQIVDPNSPTARVGSPVLSTFTKTKHARKMLSLDNAYSAQEVTDFFKGLNVQLVVEPKFDGCSLSLIYVKGHLVKAVTRGDGTIGDDVTQNARVIKSIPLQLPFPLTCEVRGEVYMPIPAFNTINETLAKEGEDLFANPRNAAAGTLKNKDSRVVAKRHLAFVAYNAVNPGGFADNYNDVTKQPGVTQIVAYTHEFVLGVLELLAFITPLSCCTINGGKVDMTRRIQFDNTFGIDKIIHELDEIRQRLTVQTDGLVFKVNDLATQDELGDGTRSPKWATAYKYPPERKPTLLKDIEISLGRLGTLTPVAILEPVQLSGTTVQRASLCNQDEIVRLGINIGDTVFVEKSAEIIPKVMGLAKKGELIGSWRMPIKCPSCGGKVEKEPGKVAYRCTNTLKCSAQAVERMKHALGKSALDWDGMGDEMVLTIVDFGLTTLSMLFDLPDAKIDELFKKAFAKKFRAERERVKGAPLWRKIHSLGIQGIGRSLSQDLCAKWSSLADMAASPDEVKKLVGEVFGTNFLDYLVENVDELEKLESFGFLFSESADRSGPLMGKTFCITGGLVSGKREEVAARIEKAGGTFKSSVSKKVDFLLVGDGGGANKADAAQKHGTKIITEEALYEMMGIPMPKAASNPLSDRGEV